MTKTEETQTEKALRLNEELRQFTGDLVRYRHLLNRSVIYTPGVRHLAEETNAYWLIDAIASWISSPKFEESVREDSRISYLHFWKLDVALNNSTAVLHAEADSDVEPFIVQEIEFTDFPLNNISIWAGYDGTHWTLYLPSEH
ncbi:MAG: DUF6876 family protein [Planctomycetota bacterium]